MGSSGLELGTHSSDISSDISSVGYEDWLYRRLLAGFGLAVGFGLTVGLTDGIGVGVAIGTVGGWMKNGLVVAASGSATGSGL